MEQNHFDGGSVIVWRWISTSLYHVMGNLIGDCYRDERKYMPDYRFIETEKKSDLFVIDVDLLLP